MAFYIIMGFLGLLLLAAVLPKMQFRDRTLQEIESAAVDDYFRRAAAAGLSTDQAIVELRLRKAFVQLREQASAGVIAEPSESQRIIASVAKGLALDLALISKAEAKQFVKWIEECELDEILTPAAMKARYDWLLSTCGKSDPRTPAEIALRIAATMN